MPVYLVNSGVKLSDNYFDLLWKSVSEKDEVSTSASFSDCETVKTRKCWLEKTGQRILQY